MGGPLQNYDRIWLVTDLSGPIIMQCAKVAPNLPESGITYQFLVSPEHDPSAAVYPPTSVGEERSSPGHCIEALQGFLHMPTGTVLAAARLWKSHSGFEASSAKHE